MFKEIVKYCVEKGIPFATYPQAIKAWRKHCKRVELQKKDPLLENAKAYHNTLEKYFRKKRKHEELFHYDFNEVRTVLKAKRLWGMQVFDCHSDEHTELIYSKDDVVICVNYSYGYVDVVGLRPSDFYVLEKAHKTPKWTNIDNDSP